MVLHITRHPLDSISSLSRFNHHLFWSWQRWHTGIDYKADSLEFYAKFWMRWNEIIEAQSPFARLAIERPEESWPEISRVLGLGEMPKIERDPTWTTKDKSPVAWSDLGALEPKVREMASRFGYKE